MAPINREKVTQTMEVDDSEASSNNGESNDPCVARKKRDPKNDSFSRLYRRVKTAQKLPSRTACGSQISGSRRKIRYPIGHRKWRGRRGMVLTPLVFSFTRKEKHAPEQQIEKLCDVIQKINIKLSKSESKAHDVCQDSPEPESNSEMSTQSPV